ncbi:GntR family transcriptional regulator [Calidifontibacillus oryziterrae]|uniref:GntR family transcriptional regulator n=1 Tax=Calidifontibacillus oryziterrae TaxID=1191699 RepID=UPI0002E064C3|nr:GntR family transcriptional regulator [Calidifontibacillus oryziterrae]
MFQLDIRSRIPIYEQLVENFKNLIINEVLKADEQLPSVRQIAKELTVNPNTIQKAYRELEHQGYIYSVPGKGSFVAPPSEINKGEKVKKMKQELSKLISEAIFLGVKKEEIISLIEEAEKSEDHGDLGDHVDQGDHVKSDDAEKSVKGRREE